MKTSRQGLGDRGEQLAAKALVEAGYTILARNVRYPEGEIDLIAQKDGLAVFVEVRIRRGQAFGSPEESITAGKRSRVVRAVERYLQEHPEYADDWRIDFVGVALSSRGVLESIDHIEGAFEG